MTKTKTELQEILEAISYLRDAVTRLEGAVYATRPFQFAPPVQTLPHPSWPGAGTICTDAPISTSTTANVQLNPPGEPKTLEQAAKEFDQQNKVTSPVPQNGWDLLNPSHPASSRNPANQQQEPEQPKVRKPRTPKAKSVEAATQTAAAVHTPVAQTVAAVVSPTPPADDVFGLGL
jgi:hypothetical protein